MSRANMSHIWRPIEFENGSVRQAMISQMGNPTSNSIVSPASISPGLLFLLFRRDCPPIKHRNVVLIIFLLCPMIYPEIRLIVIILPPILADTSPCPRDPGLRSWRRRSGPHASGHLGRIGILKWAKNTLSSVPNNATDAGAERESQSPDYDKYGHRDYYVLEEESLRRGGKRTWDLSNSSSSHVVWFIAGCLYPLPSMMSEGDSR